MQICIQLWIHICIQICIHIFPCLASSIANFGKSRAKTSMHYIAMPTSRANSTSNMSLESVPLPMDHLPCKCLMEFMSVGLEGCSSSKANNSAAYSESTACAQLLLAQLEATGLQKPASKIHNEQAQPLKPLGLGGSTVQLPSTVNNQGRAANAFH